MKRTGKEVQAQRRKVIDSGTLVNSAKNSTDWASTGGFYMMGCRLYEHSQESYQDCSAGEFATNWTSSSNSPTSITTVAGTK